MRLIEYRLLHPCGNGFGWRPLDQDRCLGPAEHAPDRRAISMWIGGQFRAHLQKAVALQVRQMIKPHESGVKGFDFQPIRPDDFMSVEHQVDIKSLPKGMVHCDPGCRPQDLRRAPEPHAPPKDQWPPDR